MDAEVGLIAGEPLDGRLDVGIARNNAYRVGTIMEGIGEEFDCDVYVGLLLFLEGIALEASGTALDFTRLEDAEDDLHIGKTTQGLEVSFLSLWCGWVCRGGNDYGREHLDSNDTLVWAEGLKEGADVKPLPFGMVLENGVVPVVAVDIDNESWLHSLIKKLMLTRRH